MQEPDAGLKKRNIGEPDIIPGGASSLTAHTPRRGESEQGSSAENEITGGVHCGGQQALVRHAICRPQPRSHCTVWKVPEDELKAGRELEFRNMLNFDEFTLVEKLLPPMTWFGLMSGGVTELFQESVCVSSRPRSLEMICLRERQTLFFYQVFVGQSCELQ